ncbi:phosphatase PAP2 family protein [Polynucleobacter necessarius]|uniref:phosphatase PAP2 family protein n=1 Tax=Polynucleobacter necessarius TaxID=576610 RepID=UPI000E08EE24|nr:phosphatase PAP2 family protein [Polynucleobacter necessarius]
MSKNAIPHFAWLIPLAPIAFAFGIYFGGLQSSSFLFINRLTQLLPDMLWAWLTFLGNGWGSFSLFFPLLLLAPRLLSAGLFAGAFSAIASTILKRIFNLPRPARVLENNSFHSIGETLLDKALPSGHTLTAFAVMSAIYFASDTENRKPLGFLFLLAALTGLSRNAVGAHWLTDVMAGAGIGLWCGMIGALCALRIPEAQLSPRKAWPRIIALGGLSSIYVHSTQVLDIDLNLPLQYASIAIVVITLIFFGKAQFGSLPKNSQ